MNFPTHFYRLSKLFALSIIVTALTFSCKDKSGKNNVEGVEKQISFQHEIIDSIGVHDPWAKIQGDMDGDGDIDIIIGGRVGPLVWYRNPDWNMFNIAPGGYDTVDGEAGDIDGDGDMDVVMGGLFWYENPGGLAEKPNATWTIHQIEEHGTHDVELTDFNDDGHLDIITRDQSDFGAFRGNTIHLWANMGNDEWKESVLDCDHGEGLRVIDLEGDGDPDIVATGYWFENGDDEAWTRHNITEWHPSANLAVADFNNDNRLDIVLTPSELANQFYKISWFEQPNDPINEPWTEHLLVDSIECVIHGVAVGDFNTDGSADIAYSEMHQGANPDEVVVLINQEEGASWDNIVLSEKGSHSIEVADINGDGFPDVFGANWSKEYQPVELWTVVK